MLRSSVPTASSGLPVPGTGRPLEAEGPGCQCQCSADHAEQRDLEKRHQQDQKEIQQLKQNLRSKEKAMTEAAALLIAAKKIAGLLGRGRGGMTTPHDHQKALEIIKEGIAAGAGASALRRQFADDGDGGDGRKGSSHQVAQRLIEKRRQGILLTCNSSESCSLSLGQIVPILGEPPVPGKLPPFYLNHLGA